MFLSFLSCQQSDINKPRKQKGQGRDNCSNEEGEAAPGAAPGAGLGAGVGSVILFINRTQIRRIQKSQKKETKMNVDCRLFLPSFG